MGYPLNCKTEQQVAKEFGNKMNKFSDIKEKEPGLLVFIAETNKQHAEIFKIFGRIRNTKVFLT